MLQENYGHAKFVALNSSLLTLAIALWIYWLWSRRHLYRFALHMPGILGLPFLGIFGLRISDPKKLLKVLAEFFKECKSYTVCIWMGTKPVLLTADPYLIEKVLSSNHLLHKASFYQPLSGMQGGSLIADPPEIWHHNRSIILPALSHKVMLSFFPIFHKAKVMAVSKFDNIVGKGEHRIHETLRRLGFIISIETTLGYVFKEGDSSDTEMYENMKVMMENATIAMILSCFHLDRLFRHYYPFDAAIDNNERYLFKIIQDKLKIRPGAEPTSMPTQNSYNIGDSQDSLLVKKKTPTIFFDIAIDNFEKNQFKWNDIYCEAGTLILAAFETSATALLSAIVMLAMHPEYQERLFEEIFNYYPDKDFVMTHEDIKHLPYLSMIINETQRLIPPVPLYGRHVVEDTALSSDLFLPKGLDILLNAFQLHRRTDIWGPRAETFYPDHFLPENLTNKHSHVFIPFSKGPRQCIGFHYAHNSISVLLSGLVRNFRFTTSFKYEDINFYEAITIRFTEEPAVEVHRREI